ncbi:MAG: hypothetical protein ACREYE_04135 [Gammaproteobacteria bacterium]
MKKSAALGISCSGGARNPHVFQYTLRFLRSGGTRPPFARDDFFTSSHFAKGGKQCRISTPLTRSGPCIGVTMVWNCSTNASSLEKSAIFA